jgi:hypothetical protein
MSCGAWAVKRIAAAFGVTLILAGCGGGGVPDPQPFPGSARAKANELVRQADVLNLTHEDAPTLASRYGTDGGPACNRPSAQDRKDAAALYEAAGVGDLPLDPRFTVLVLMIYCPRLL